MMAQKDETASRLVSIPGFGPITASAMMPTIQDTTSFAGPREFAAFLGLTPKQNSSGGKPKLGRISKMGNRYLRKLLVVGAYAVHLMSGPAWFRPMPWPHNDVGYTSAVVTLGPEFTKSDCNPAGPIYVQA